MKRGIIKFLFLITCGAVLLTEIGICQTKSRDYVPDKVTAVRIAEAVWLPIYGKQIQNEKPFVARLTKAEVWIVEGTSNEEKGGVAYIEIRKSDCRILKVTHGK